MPSILIIERNFTIRQHNVKTFVEDELYKKAGFKTKDGFVKQTQWSFTINNEIHQIELYGKINGRAGQENKYEFPPPVDNTLFFGSCVLVCKNTQGIIDFLPKHWEKAYEILYGGFDETAETEDDDTEDETDDNLPRTKEGYVKDGFIVDDDTDESTEEDEAEVKGKTPLPIKLKAPPKSEAKNAPEASAKNAPEVSAKNAPTDELYLSCTDELTEENYV